MTLIKEYTNLRGTNTHKIGISQEGLGVHRCIYKEAAFTGISKPEEFVARTTNGWYHFPFSTAINGLGSVSHTPEGQGLLYQTT